MFVFFELLLAGAVMLTAWRSRPSSDGALRVHGFLAGRSAVMLAGLIAGGVTWYVWGSLNDVAAVHDEASYLLQAQLFSRFEWTAPAAPIPAFFEQFHVFVDPVIASKYPPGHSLLLVPGLWLGVPGLVPVLLVAATGALLFALARRVSNPWIATLTFLLWLTGWTELRFHSAYFSENTTSLCLLGGFWALLEWRARREPRWLAALALCVGWGGITRPVTMLPFAIIAGVVVLRTLHQHRAWRTVGPAAAVGLVTVALLLVSNYKVTGSWRSTPWKVYAREYMPWDAPGFGFDSTPPTRQLPRVMRTFGETFGAIHKAHTLSRLPEQTWGRVVNISQNTLATWQHPDVRTLLAPFAFIGIMLMALGRPIRESRIALLCALAVFGSYLTYAHPATWTLYYLEISWLVPFAAALGLWSVGAMIARRVRMPSLALIREYSTLPALATAAMIGAVAALGVPRVEFARHYSDAAHHNLRGWRDFLNQTLAGRRAIIFVRYTPTHYVHESLITNDPNLASANLWVVYDRGAENQKLAALSPDRATFLFDEKTHSLMEFPALAHRELHQ